MQPETPSPGRDAKRLWPSIPRRPGRSHSATLSTPMHSCRLCCRASTTRRRPVNPECRVREAHRTAGARRISSASHQETGIKYEGNWSLGGPGHSPPGPHRRPGDADEMPKCPTPPRSPSPSTPDDPSEATRAYPAETGTADHAPPVDIPWPPTHHRDQAPTPRATTCRSTGKTPTISLD